MWYMYYIETIKQHKWKDRDCANIYSNNTFQFQLGTPWTCSQPTSWGASWELKELACMLHIYEDLAHACLINKSQNFNIILLMLTNLAWSNSVLPFSIWLILLDVLLLSNYSENDMWAGIILVKFSASFPE